MVEAFELAEQRREKWRARLRVLADKALLNHRSLSLQDLDDICDLAAKLGPASYSSVPEASQRQSYLQHEPFKPLSPSSTYRVDEQAALRQAHAWEYIAAQIGTLSKADE